MIKQFFVAFLTFLIIDALWLGIFAKNFYAKHLGYLMTQTPNFLAAGIFYLIYILGLIVFVVSPSLKNNSLISAIMLGAFFGLCSYATYDLTNLATIKDWPLIVTIIDLIWGTVLTATISTITFLILRK